MHHAQDRFHILELEKRKFI
ncbi:hypothetical protein R3I94_001243 [Phoxinus phoxinus]